MMRKYSAFTNSLLWNTMSYFRIFIFNSLLSFWSYNPLIPQSALIARSQNSASSSLASIIYWLTNPIVGKTSLTTHHLTLNCIKIKFIIACIKGNKICAEQSSSVKACQITFYSLATGWLYFKVFTHHIASTTIFFFKLFDKCL